MKVKINKVFPCPFCGGKPKVLEINKGWAGFTGMVYDYSVRCFFCRATTATFHTLEAAREAWNKRVAEKGEET